LANLVLVLCCLVLQALRVNPALVDVHNNLGDLWRAQVCVGDMAEMVIVKDAGDIYINLF
jgi:hypothetical protein